MSRQAQDPKPIEADVVIIGSGIAGSLAAWSLAQAGVKVAVLEAGPRVNRGEAVATFQNAMIKTPESAYPSVPYAPRPSTADPNFYLVQDGPTNFKSTYERRVGGTTWHWLGTALRLVPNDFKLKSTYGVGEDWPISYDDLEPWYGKAEDAIGVAGDDNADLGVTRSTKYPMPRIEPTYLDQQIGKAADKVGLKVVSTPQARNSVDRDGRPACCGNSSCIPVCPIGAKYDGAVHAGKAEGAGALIMEQAIAYKVNVDAEGKISGINFKFSDGSDASAVGKIYVLAAHAIETPKLLLISRTDALPNGVANSSDQVGRNLMDHPTQLSWALSNEPLYPFRGPLATSGIEMLRDGEFRKQRSAFRIEIGNDGWSWPFGWPLASAPGLIDQGLRGKALQEHLNVIASQQFRVASLTEQLPDPNNRIVPAWGQVDALGIPAPRITYSVPPYALDGMIEARKVHDQLFDALGVSFRQHRAEYEGAGHIMGTYRMGTDPKTSVVDADCRSHDHSNLFMLGSGVFPSTGTSNPTLTIAALALRAADAIKRSVT